MSIGAILIVIAAVLFFLAAFGVGGSMAAMFVPLGLGLFALGHVIGGFFGGTRV